ncbi:MAG TPA: hypothetical protein VFZ26_01965 [Gemmatimonadales bacterium]
MRAGLALLTVLPGLAGVPAPGAAQSALAHYDLEAPPAWVAELPVALAEISGLAVTEDGRLYAHGDEQAAVFRFDLKTRRVTERFGLAGRRRVLAGDFEGIEVVDDRVFLVASDGTIYEGRLAGDGTLVEAVRRTAGLGGGCEVEGMTWDARTRSLLVLCKQVRSKQWKDQVVILAVSADDWRFERKPRILVSEERLAAVTGSKGFNGSAIARHPRTGTFLLVAGPQRTFAEIDGSGRVLGGGKLGRSLHRQPEGLAVTPDLTLLISDEAGGKAATLTAYAYRP